jgi:hypothetical protein
MSGTIDIAPDGSCLLVSFPYREDLVELVRNIPGRRWDKPSKTWRVPLDQAESVVKIFMAHGFAIMPGVATALATGGRDTGLDRIKYQAVDKDADSYTISALNLRVAEVLRAEFKGPMWVVGELQNFDKGKGRKHRYFELVERVEDELGEEEVRASVSAVVWAKSLPVIQKRLGGKGGKDTRKLDLADGVKGACAGGWTSIRRGVAISSSSKISTRTTPSARSYCAARRSCSASRRRGCARRTSRCRCPRSRCASA